MSRWELTLGGRPLSLLKSGDGRLRLGGVLPHESRPPGAAGQQPRVKRLRSSGTAPSSRSASSTRRPSRSRRAPARVRRRLRRPLRGPDVVRDRSASIVAAAARALAALPLPGARLPRRDDDPRRAERDRRVRRRAQVVAQAPPRIDGTTSSGRSSCRRAACSTTLVKVEPAREQRPLRAGARADFGERLEPHAGPLTDWLERIPRLESDSACSTTSSASRSSTSPRCGSPAICSASATSSRRPGCRGS